MHGQENMKLQLFLLSYYIGNMFRPIYRSSLGLLSQIR